MNEKKLIEGIRNRDESAAAYAIDRYSRLFWSAAAPVLRNIGTAEDLEECVADAFVYLWEHPEKFDPARGSLKSWLAMIGRYPMEEVLTLEAYIPDGRGDLNDGFIGVPLLYIVTYETSAIREDSLAFLYGQLLDFTEMERYKIYEDEKYSCYEISPLLYTDAAEYARTWLEATGQDGTYDEAAEQRLLHIYNYNKENAGRLMEYVE